MKKPRVHVTDHAVLRYLERIWGVDVDGLRARIARMAANGVDHEASAVNHCVTRLVLRGTTVVTVMARGDGRKGTPKRVRKRGLR